MDAPFYSGSQIVLFVNGSTTNRPSLQGARHHLRCAGSNWASAQPSSRAVSGTAIPPGGRPRECIIITDATNKFAFMRVSAIDQRHNGECLYHLIQIRYLLVKHRTLGIVLACGDEYGQFAPAVEEHAGEALLLAEKNLLKGVDSVLVPCPPS
jgi:hypothetical protein